MTFDRQHPHLTKLDFDHAGHTGFERLAYKAHGKPTALNDGNDSAGIGIKFEIGYKWINLDTEIAYYCVVNTTGSAVWREEVNTQGYQSVLIAEPVNSSHASTKKYVDNMAILMPFIL